MVDYFFPWNSFMQLLIFFISLTLLILSIYFSKNRHTKKWKYALKNLVTKTIFQTIYLFVSLFGIAISLLFGSDDWLHWALLCIVDIIILCYFYFRDKEQIHFPSFDRFT